MLPLLKLANEGCDELKEEGYDDCDCDCGMPITGVLGVEMLELLLRYPPRVPLENPAGRDATPLIFLDGTWRE